MMFRVEGYLTSEMLLFAISMKRSQLDGVGSRLGALRYRTLRNAITSFLMRDSHPFWYRQNSDLQ